MQDPALPRDPTCTWLQFCIIPSSSRARSPHSLEKHLLEERFHLLQRKMQEHPSHFHQHMLGDRMHQFLRNGDHLLAMYARHPELQHDPNAMKFVRGLRLAVSHVRGGCDEAMRRFRLHPPNDPHDALIGPWDHVFCLVWGITCCRRPRRSRARNAVSRLLMELDASGAPGSRTSRLQWSRALMDIRRGIRIW